MDAFWVWLIGAGFALVLGSFTYTFVIDRIHTRRMETAEKNWATRADDMRTARDSQISELRADAMAAISDNNVKLYEQRLHAATHFATTEMLEKMETRFAAMIGKVETKVDRLTDLVKANGGHK